MTDRAGVAPMLNRALVAGLLVAAAAFLFHLAALVREAFSPNEPYASHIGLPLDQCVAAQDGLAAAEARAFCARPVPKRP